MRTGWLRLLIGLSEPGGMRDEYDSKTYCFTRVHFGVWNFYFIGQNAQVVELRFLFWKTAASRPLVLLGTFLVGLAGGWLSSWALEKHRESSKKVNLYEAPMDCPVSEGLGIITFSTVFVLILGK